MIKEIMFSYLQLNISREKFLDELKEDTILDKRATVSNKGSIDYLQVWGSKALSQARKIVRRLEMCGCRTLIY